MTHPSDLALAPAPSVSQGLSRALVFIGIAALMVVTLATPGSTRMYAWPWSLAYAVAVVVPALWLLIRLADARRPLTLPGLAWHVATIVLGGGILASAWLSPFRGPSLQGSAPLLAALALFLVVVDWLHASPDETPARRRRLLSGVGGLLAIVALTSMSLWVARLPGLSDVSQALASRNPYPLGHSNYTAGIALLMLPCFGALIALGRGWRRVLWIGALTLALGMLVTSGSRGGLVGLVALTAVVAPLLARAFRWRLSWVAVIGLLTIVGLLVLNPRTRAMIRTEPASAEPNLSNVQRAAMLTAGLRMGSDRPLLGSGPGSTPFVYPRYRAGLQGGVENVLQLHSTPVQLWAELGGIGLAGVLAFVFLALRATAKAPPRSDAVGQIGLSAVGSAKVDDLAYNRPDEILTPLRVVLGLSGYAVFSLTDWQLDVPVFAYALALAAALVACPSVKNSCAARAAIGGLWLLAVGSIAWLGRAEPTPALNVRALALAVDSAKSDEAVARLRESLALNPDQEIAHFNLGWLLVVRDPAAAERHFLAAARLVPDKGGVYFGLGLARLNQSQPEVAARAFALECVNDPLFLTSPWWRVAPLSELRKARAGEFIRLSQEVATRLAPRGDWYAREAAYQAALTRWLLGQAAPGEMLARALTSERVNYFARRPQLPDFTSGPVRAYRRERTGYPVLMRDLDLPTPSDLYDVQETPLAADDLRFLFPRKGWLPSPLLLDLLDETISASKSTRP